MSSVKGCLLTRKICGHEVGNFSFLHFPAQDPGNGVKGEKSEPARPKEKIMAVGVKPNWPQQNAVASYEQLAFLGATEEDLSLQTY